MAQQRLAEFPATKGGYYTRKLRKLKTNLDFEQTLKNGGKILAEIGL